MDDLVRNLLSKLTEVEEVQKKYKDEHLELEQLVLNGESQYKDLFDLYVSRINELDVQLVQIRHAVFKLKEAKRHSSEANRLVDEIFKNFELDNELKVKAESRPSGGAISKQLLPF